MILFNLSSCLDKYSNVKYPPKLVAKIDNLQNKLIKLARGGFKHHTTVSMGHVKHILEEAFRYYLGYDVVSIDD